MLQKFAITYTQNRQIIKEEVELSYQPDYSTLKQWVWDNRCGLLQSYALVPFVKEK